MRETRAYRPVSLEMHWKQEDYIQRMTTKQWREVLIEERDSIVFKGRVRKLVGTIIFPGVVEVWKAPLIATQ